MFTGIITDVGRVASVSGSGDTRFEIETYMSPTALNWVRLSHVRACVLRLLKKVHEMTHWFAVEASKETLDVTTAGDWQAGHSLNLERALKLGDELGGHIVSGHVDALAEIVNIRPEGDSQRFTFRASKDIMRFVAPKGSITLDGTSLTVNEVEGDTFGVNLISHTQSVTSWGASQVGDRVNLEIDVLARYVARLKDTEGDTNV